MTRQSRMLLVIVIFAIVAVVVLAMMANRYAGMLEEREAMQVSPPDMEQVLVELRHEGLIRDPVPEELEHAAAWDSLPEAEKQSIDEELDGLHLDPLLSEIIDLNRAGRVVEL